MSAHILLYRALTGGVFAALSIAGGYAQSSSPKTLYCYDAKDPHDVRLWEGKAPGAVGTDPCRDIPFLRVFRPGGATGATDLGIIAIPGGGYNELIDAAEQTPVAQYFANQFGITTFVLYYRLVQSDGTYRFPVPMWDGQRAVRYVRFNAAQYGIDPHRLGVFGFSAGGHLAATLGVYSKRNFNLPAPDGAVDQTDARPDFLGLGYPVISMDPDQYASLASLRSLLRGYKGGEREWLEDLLSLQKHVNDSTPPTFLFECFDDQVVSVQNSSLFYEALVTAKIPSEDHIFQLGHHGVGLATNEPYEYVWPELFRGWLSEIGLLPKPAPLVPETGK